VVGTRRSAYAPAWSVTTPRGVVAQPYQLPETERYAAISVALSADADSSSSPGPEVPNATRIYDVCTPQTFCPILDLTLYN